MIPVSRRERLVSLILFGLFVAVGSLVLIEWAQLDKELRQRQAETAIAAKSELTFEPLSEIDFELPVIESYSDLVERPLFVEGRRPLVKAPESAPLQANRLKTGTLKAKLMGVYSGSDGMTALILNAEGKYVRVRATDIVDGWQVEALYPDRVTLKQGGETQDLKLHKPKPKYSRQPKRPVRQNRTARTDAEKARVKARIKARMRGHSERNANSKTRPDQTNQKEADDKTDPNAQTEEH